MRGIRAVNKALVIFDRIKAKLQRAVEKCLEEINEREAEIMDIKADVTDLKYAQERAAKVLSALEKILEI